MIKRASKREKIFELFDEGFSAKEITKYMKIAYSTLRTYRAEWQKEHDANNEIMQLKELVETLKTENEQLRSDKEFLMGVINHVE